MKNDQTQMAGVRTESAGLRLASSFGVLFSFVIVLLCLSQPSTLNAQPTTNRVLELDGTNSWVELPSNIFTHLTETTVEDRRDPFTASFAAMQSHELRTPLNVVVDGPPDLGTLHADRTKVRQGLFHLLSNACKFTEPASPTPRRDSATPSSGHPAPSRRSCAASAGARSPDSTPGSRRSE